MLILILLFVVFPHPPLLLSSPLPTSHCVIILLPAIVLIP